MRWVHAEETPLTIPGANLIFDALDVRAAAESELATAHRRRARRHLRSRLAPIGRALTSARSRRSAPADHVRGDGPEAIVYLDLACPQCAAAWARIRELPLRLCVRHFPLASKRPRSPALHAAAEAAAAQRRTPSGRWWTRSTPTTGTRTTPISGSGPDARPRPRALRARPAVGRDRRSGAGRFRERDPRRRDRDAHRVRRRRAPRWRRRAATRRIRGPLTSRPLENESSSKRWPPSGRPKGKANT